MDLTTAKKLLSDAGLFYYPIGTCEEKDDEQVLNMNDTWFWASAFGQKVDDSEILDVCRLFVDYGFCGVLYWVSEKNEKMEAEFSHVNRMVQFVRNEERVRKEHSTLSEYAYAKAEFIISA